MTGLRSALKRYLNMRQGLGYKYQDQARQRAQFRNDVAWLQQGSKRIANG
jgi:hypothetical protein